MEYTAEDLLSDIGFARTTTRAREVFKKKKSKKVNNSSRLSEEQKSLDFVPSCLAVAQSLGVGQEAVDNVIAEAATTSSQIGRAHV